MANTNNNRASIKLQEMLLLLESTNIPYTSPKFSELLGERRCAVSKLPIEEVSVMEVFRKVELWLNMTISVLAREDGCGFLLYECYVHRIIRDEEGWTVALKEIKPNWYYQRESSESFLKALDEGLCLAIRYSIIAFKKEK